jgi:hypothetical protein
MAVESLRPASAFIDQGRQELDDPDFFAPPTAEAVGGAIFNQIRIELEGGDIDGLTALVPKMMYSAVLARGPDLAQEPVARRVCACRDDAVRVHDTRTLPVGLVLDRVDHARDRDQLARCVAPGARSLPR